MNLSSCFYNRKLGLNRNSRTIACLLTAAGIALVEASSRAELIPSARLADWTPGVSVGVPGGIPTNRTKIIDVTQPPYGADATGAAEAHGAIQAAVNAATAGTVVYLPPGTYRLGGSIVVDENKSNITIRGAGPSTIIASRSTSQVFYVGSTTDYAWQLPDHAQPKSNNTITAGLTKGSTVLTIADTSPFLPGHLIQIALENQTDDAAIAAGATPVISVTGFPTLRRQMSRIVSKTATTLTIFPAVHFTPDAGLTAKVNFCRRHLEGFGLENLSIECANDTALSAVWFMQCFGSWVKDVKIANVSNYGIHFSDSLNCEIRRSTVARRKVGGSNGAGFLLNHACNSLLEDNIIYGVFPPIEVNMSSTGNVIAYNFVYDEIGCNINTNHGPHNSFNLYEGNIAPNLQSDGYFGSASDDTVFRNWLTGTLFESNRYIFIMGLNRFTRNYSFIGNIFGSKGWPYTPTGYSFGNPNMGNSSFEGTAQPSENRFWSSWKSTGALSTRTSDTAGTITVSAGRLYTHASKDYPHPITLVTTSGERRAMQIQAYAQTENVVSFQGSDATLPPQGTTFEVRWGYSGYQEADLDVERTTILKANYKGWEAGGLAIPPSEQIAPDSLPNSLYRTTKPDWFGDLKWPPFDPFNPAPSYTSIPAGYRYMNRGTEPPTSVARAPSNVRILRR
jgi:hypothetical protein